ncbi:MAG TPA: AmmeMemoRadiSam system protein B [Burkholderiaceae bacterium]|nr:AmmeMemoRadiSam system protein B [Burkholderiaceae bacterium]
MPAAPSTRPSAVAGMFYPGDPAQLRRDIAKMLAPIATDSSAARPQRPPKVLIVPHAGYVYSGPIAAHAYGLLAPFAAQIRRVVLLGPTHRVAVHGLAIPTVAYFETPLGRVALDVEALARLAELPHVVRSDAAHAMEHSLEVQLPFLQSVLQDFHLLPLAVGDVAPTDVAAVIENVWGGDETVILISSDLSHYHPYNDARRIDADTVERILALQTNIRHEQACGATPINGAVVAARHHGLQPRLLDLRNSGDTAGDRHHVVGYAAIAFEAGHVIH